MIVTGALLPVIKNANFTLRSSQYRSALGVITPDGNRVCSNETYKKKQYNNGIIAKGRGGYSTIALLHTFISMG